jgi:integrase
MTTPPPTPRVLSLNNAYTNFIQSIDSKHTKRDYRVALSYFMRFVKITSYEDIVKMDVTILEDYIRDFIIYLKDERKLAPASTHMYIAGLAHFFNMNDISIRWKKLKKFKPRTKRKQADDKPYTREQIQQLLLKAAPRERAYILLMSSAGLRRGAIPLLKFGDLTPITKYNIYKIRVYANEPEEYVTYCTVEAKKAIDEYLEWRLRLGEHMKNDTPVFRKRFDTLLEVHRPEHITDYSISWNIQKLINDSGVREKQRLTELNPLPKRTSLMSTHALRKFFKTNAKLAGLDSLYLEKLMGHDIGLDESYFIPTDEQVLEGNDKMIGYIGVIDDLTINEENRLKRKVETLQVRADKIKELEETLIEFKNKLGL